MLFLHRALHRCLPSPLAEACSSFHSASSVLDTKNRHRTQPALIEPSTDSVTGRHQVKLIDTIVTKVSRELKKAYICVSNNLVGIDGKVKEVMGMLDVEAPDVRFVAILGMGGIGKTTLAKVVYNRIADHFDACSFLQDVGETSKRSPDGIRQLQSQLVAKLSRCKPQEFATVDEGIYVLKRRIREKKVLILLDNVDHVDQLDALAAEADWFGRGSRIIITTRNMDVLRAVVGKLHIYKVGVMEEAQALQLFCKHALRKDAPSVRLRALSEEIMWTTGGLPLALEVIGSFLHGKSEVIWRETSKKLKLVPDMEFQNTLRISYDALEREQQQMFLDVACLFIGEDKRNVADFWEDRYESPPEVHIEVLQLLSFIRIGEDNRLGMHHLLRDLGRQIVRRENYKEPGKRSRLWGKEAINVLQNNQGSRSIEAIRLEYETGLENCCFTAEQFRELSNLRFLQLGRANLAGNFEHLLPELRWLRWRISPLSSTATNLNLKKVVILEVSRSRFTRDWILGTQFSATRLYKIMMAMMAAAGSSSGGLYNGNGSNFHYPSNHGGAAGSSFGGYYNNGNGSNSYYPSNHEPPSYYQQYQGGWKPGTRTTISKEGREPYDSVFTSKPSHDWVARSCQSINI